MPVLYESCRGTVQLYEAICNATYDTLVVACHHRHHRCLHCASVDDEEEKKTQDEEEEKIEFPDDLQDFLRACFVQDWAQRATCHDVCALPFIALRATNERMRD